MFGLASISEFQKRVDLFDKDDWQRTFDGGTLAGLAAARDPVQTGLIGFPFSPVGVWAFEPSKSAIRIVSGNLPGRSPRSSNRIERKRATLDFFVTLAPFLLRNSRLRPTVEQLCDMVRNSQNTLPEGEYHKRLSEICDKYVLEWTDVKDIELALLIDRQKVRSKEKGVELLRPNASALVNQIAGLIHDYHAFRLPIWRSTPATIVGNESIDTLWLRKLFADPLSFHPTDSDAEDAFFWPWQRCLTVEGKVSALVRYRPIPTTSLVMDIRGSTSAMELTDPPDKFSEFIDQVVGIARTTILQHGGYFDKETGDGVVGHFCSRNNVPALGTRTEASSMEILAVKAGREITQKVHDLCRRYQRWLRHGMDKLGGAIGIHTGTAVWLADEMHIRAIGSSVVGAARLCSCAESGEIVVSNRTYQNAELFSGSVDGLMFKQKTIDIQEYGGRIGTYAYAARVIA